MALCQACCVKAHPQACTHLVQQPVEDPAEHGEQAGNEQGRRVVIVAVPQKEILERGEADQARQYVCVGAGWRGALAMGFRHTTFCCSPAEVRGQLHVGRCHIAC